MVRQNEIEWEVYYLLKNLAVGMYFNQFYLAEITLTTNALAG